MCIVDLSSSGDAGIGGHAGHQALHAPSHEVSTLGAPADQI